MVLFVTNMWLNYLCCVTVDFIYSSIVSLCYFYAILVVDDKCCL